MARETRSRREVPRDRLVGTALRLFSRRGFHATGIDTILAEAGVAKMTLYKHFTSKDDLILAALERQGAEFRDWLIQRVNALSRTPRDQLLAIFTAIGEWGASPRFAGCIFGNAVAEFHRMDDPIHAAAHYQKKWVHDFVEELGSAARARDPKSLACQLCVVMDGAFAAASLTCNGEPFRQAALAARILVDHAISKPRKPSPRPSFRRSAAKPHRRRRH